MPLTLIRRRYMAVLLLVLALVPGPSLYASGFVFPLPPNLVTPSSGHRNNVFYVGQPVTFALNKPSAVRYEVRDYWGNLVDQGPTGASITVNASQPGWYKLNLYGNTSADPWGYVVGGGTFVIFRPDPHFPVVQDPGVAGSGPFDNTGAGDEVLRGVTALGPQRHSVPDAGQPDQAVSLLAGSIAIDKQYYLGFNDPVRPRDLMIAFPNGTASLDGVAKIVRQFQNDVHYWEPRNEPNAGATGAGFAANEMAPFYRTVKSVDPSLKVLGPGTVSVNPGTLPWLTDFFQSGGGDSIDAFSFHAYNMLNGDLWLARTSLGSMKTLLAQYGQEKKEIWQTEQGYMAALYGAYEPRHQGRWTMLQMMAFEQYGITKEHNHLWYDKSHGFWPFPTFTENGDGTLNPAGPLMRVWSEELYGTGFVQAYDLGDPGNKLYLGSLFQGPGKSVAAFMSAGGTDGQITLRVAGGDHVHLVSAFGAESDLPVRNGQVTLPVPEIPVYVEMSPGQTVTPVPVNWGPNLAMLPGVTARALDANGLPMAGDDVNKIHNGVMENWYWTQQSGDGPWISNVSQFPATAEIDLPVPQAVSRVAIYCPVPWQGTGSLLDYELQYDKNGQWVTIDHVQEPTKTSQVFSPSVRCTVDSYYSDRCIFTHQFAVVTTQRIRVLVHDCTWGGGATQDVVNAGGQTGPHQFSIREIEVYSPYYDASTTKTLSGQALDANGQGVPGVTMTLRGTQAASVVTDAGGNYTFRGLPTGGAYTLTPTNNDYSFAARSQTISHLVTDTVVNFTATLLPSGSGTGLRGDYYSDGYDDITNAFKAKYFVTSRVDAAVNFPNWSYTSPAPGLSAICYAVRWTGQIEAKYSETYTFTTNADDGVRLWVNGQLLIDHWVRNQGQVNTGTVTLQAGHRTDIRLEYFQLAGDARCVLSWASPSQPQQVVPQQYLYPAVVNVPPTVGISSPSAGAALSSGVSVPVTAVAMDPDGTVSQVAFYANGAPIGTATGSPYTVSWTPTTPGSYSLTAVAVDNAGASTTSDPVILSVPDLPPTVAVTAPAGGTTVVLGASPTVGATASDADGTVSQVAFYANGAPIGTATGSPYTVSWTPTTPGSYSLTAVAIDNLGVSTTSSPVTVNAVAPNVPPTVAISAPAGGGSLWSGVSVPVTAVAMDPDGTVSQVAFYANGAPIGTATGSPYTVSWTPPAPGPYALTAVATDNAGAGTASSPVSVTAAKRTPTVSITSPGSGAVASLYRRISLTALANEAGGQVTQVAFYANGAQIGTSKVAPYSLNWTPVASRVKTLGLCRLTAVAKDANGTATTSVPVTLTLRP